jgi:hypothetical protein
MEELPTTVPIAYAGILLKNDDIAFKKHSAGR